eukprot:5910785-Amphidinium_carterae.1
MYGKQNNDPMRDVVQMMQELIASIQTLADGVTTKTITMQRAMVTRRKRLAEHLKIVFLSLVTGRQTQRHKTVASIPERSCRNCYPHSPVELRRK